MAKELMDFSPCSDRLVKSAEKGKIPSGNKGGRPRNWPKYGNCRLNIYLSEEEFRLFNQIISEAWHDKNSSGAGRYLLMKMLHEWVRNGKMKALKIEGHN